MRVGFVGWRGMVGSVLMQRMLAERDFATIEPVFFSTSSVGGKVPDIRGATGTLRDGNDPAAYRGLDAVVTCQGGDFSNAMFPRLRDGGFDGVFHFPSWGGCVRGVEAEGVVALADNAGAM